MNQTIQILGKGVALILLLACVLSSIILGRSLQQMRKDQEGILVKGIVSASQGVFQITGPHSTETSGGGSL